jgi:hypothetical protein
VGDEMEKLLAKYPGSTPEQLFAEMKKRFGGESLH